MAKSWRCRDRHVGINAQTGRISTSKHDAVAGNASSNHSLIKSNRFRLTDRSRCQNDTAYIRRCALRKFLRPQQLAIALGPGEVSQNELGGTPEFCGFVGDHSIELDDIRNTIV